MPCTLFDFADPLAVQAWYAIDDRVMGGLSHSQMRHDPQGHAVFEGQVSLDRGGGFASVRSRPGPLGQPGVRACWAEVRGAAAPYKLSLLTDDGFDSVHYQASFDPAGSDWHTVRLPLAAFAARFRGRDVPQAPPLDPARIRQVGLLTASRQAGPFVLHIRRIEWICAAP